MSTKESLLGTIKSTRGMVSLTVIIVAFILSFMVVDTRNKCVNNPNDTNKFKSDSSLMYYLSILIIIVCVVLLGYDVGSYLEFF